MARARPSNKLARPVNFLSQSEKGVISKWVRHADALLDFQAFAAYRSAQLWPEVYLALIFTELLYVASL